jgi:D-tyrosyl-tRNA(Tyr) deacylase
MLPVLCREASFRPSDYQQRETGTTQFIVCGTIIRLLRGPKFLVVRSDFYYIQSLTGTGQPAGKEDPSDMRAVIQRVSRASVSIDSKVIGEVGRGVLVLLGVRKDDTEANADRLAEKVANLRIFNDEDGKMNLSCLDIGGDALIVSQFTLYGNCRKGRRPSYVDAAEPEEAERLYEYFVEKLREYPLKVATGVFGAMMLVSLVNDGPVTLIVET